MNIYSKQEELNRKINEGKEKDDETRELFMEIIGLMFEEGKRNEQLFLDGVMNGEINSKMLIVRSTEEFLDKKAFVTYLQHMSIWINHQKNQIEIDIKDDDPRIDKLNNYGIKNVMGIVLKSIALADGLDDLELKKIYYMIASKHFYWVNKYGQMYASPDIFPYKYFHHTEELVEEILVKHY
ncbi:MAG: hypothetical protein WC276_06990 [Sedimentibacter sp.]